MMYLFHLYRCELKEIVFYMYYIALYNINN